ncbi:pyrroline-5-carboxylate reductase [Candidatus Uhrbacteria bacterium]|nr:pyrroline-5-carboxylate reductase [Candidatus Uhrbacteria bacterium]
MIKKFVVIGYGVMGSAIVRRAIAARVLRPAQYTVVTPSMDPVAACKKADVVLLAVKPQDALPILQVLRGMLRPQTLVISIMAGVSLSTLQRGLGHARIIRAMPNTPAQIGEGMTAWVASVRTSAGDCAFAKKLFGALGKELHVKNEKYIDAATAVSGSGPAYVFAFVESLIIAAEQLGFTKKQATMLVYQTVRGSSALLEASADDSATLRERVTSKKGTTAAALAVLQKRGMTRILHDAVFAAHRRARELGK